MTLPSSALTVALAFSLFLQPLALAAPTVEENNRALLEKIENYDVNKMSLDELKAALLELNMKLSDLEVDLRTAKIMADGRTAVKVRNWTMGIGASAVAFMIITDIRCKGPDCGGGLVAGLLVFLPLTLATTAVEQSYIYLTNSEVHDLKSTISQLKDKISDLAWKIRELE